LITAAALAACLMSGAATYQVPPAVMIAIMQVEGGRVGQQVGPNVNGTYDLGPMQVNTRWLPELARYWHIDLKTAHKLVRDDGCVNVKVAAWILHQKIKDGGSLRMGIQYYHSATPYLGRRYAEKVISVLDRRGLIKYDNGTSKPAYTYYAQR